MKQKSNMVVQNKGSPYVQQATLVKLICARCKKYLSYPPIYRHALEGPVCGRCPVDDTPGFTRDELYEQAVEYQKFPCINYESGCLENLFPHQTAEHEKICPYMKFDCPTKVYNNCTWQGAVANVLNHFETIHPTFILQDGQFEVDFVNNHKENYIMSFAEDIYIVTREANSAEKTFAIIVSYLGSSSDMKKYTYTLTLESGNRAYKYSFSQEVGKKLELQGQLIREMLHDPVSIIANINIEDAESSMDRATSVDKEIDDTPNSLVDYSQVEELECPVCFYYMVPPVYQCEAGHSICGTCKQNQKECPTCRGAINRTQNYVLEKIINNMIYPCRHSGCRFATKARDIRKHEETCMFGPFKCPLQEYEKCAEIFPVSQLFKHINSNHYESLVELDTISIPFDNTLKEDIEEGYILKHGSLLFKLCFKYDHVEEVFYWAVQLVGPAEENMKYKFELEIIDNHGKNNRIYMKTNCCPLALKENTFDNEDNYVYFEYDQISRFIKNQLTYRVRIVPNKY